jgi:hypothetical protein
MAYCVKCGVELAESEKRCPLCSTLVYHPDVSSGQGEGLYPKTEIKKEKVSKIGVLFVLSALCIIPALIVFLCDMKINLRVTWSGYVMLALALGYIIVVLPIWFKRPNPVIFAPVDFAAIIGYLLYICLASGGDWFLTLAFPVAGAVGVLVVTVITLCKYVKRGYLYIAGGAVLGIGAISFLCELMINITFCLERFIFWSIYSLIACFIVGMLLIVIAICRPLRQSLQKIFFI